MAANDPNFRDFMHTGLQYPLGHPNWWFCIRDSQAIAVTDDEMTNLFKKDPQGGSAEYPPAVPTSWFCIRGTDVVTITSDQMRVIVQARTPQISPVQH